MGSRFRQQLFLPTIWFGEAQGRAVGVTVFCGVESEGGRQGFEKVLASPIAKESKRHAADVSFALPNQRR